MPTKTHECTYLRRSCWRSWYSQCVLLSVHHESQCRMYVQKQ